MERSSKVLPSKAAVLPIMLLAAAGLALPAQMVPVASTEDPGAISEETGKLYTAADVPTSLTLTNVLSPASAPLSPPVAVATTALSTERTLSLPVPVLPSIDLLGAPEPAPAVMLPYPKTSLEDLAPFDPTAAPDLRSLATALASPSADAELAPTPLPANLGEPASLPSLPPAVSEPEGIVSSATETAVPLPEAVTPSPEAIAVSTPTLPVAVLPAPVALVAPSPAGSPTGPSGSAETAALSSSSAVPAGPLSAPDPGAPVTLPPRPARVRDLPSVAQGDRPRVRPFQAAAFGLTASTLGAGGELAIPIARTLNVRVGGSYLRESFPFNVDGIDYLPGLKFTSGRATIDWFPHRGEFHISAGALYFRNSIGGSASVSEGQTFSLGGTNYINSVDDPVGGTASVAYGKQIAPLLTLGFGNILPRSGRHLSMPIEFGGAYMQPPALSLKLAGTACTNQGCFNAATDPQVQANLRKEITTLQGDLRWLQVYPVISLGLACRF